MNPTYLPSTAQLQELFTREIGAAGGTVSDAYNDGRRLFLRAILPQVREVRPQDSVQGGVALRATDCQVHVHPYLFRQVCRNGAIMAQALGTRRVQRLEETPYQAPAEYEVAEVLAEVREVMQACCAPEVFAANVRDVRAAVASEVDHLLTNLPHLLRLSKWMEADIFPRILERYFSGTEGRSAFGLMNAVTSVARDTEDPELRWDLEELGGGIPALLHPRLRPDGAAMALRA